MSETEKFTKDQLMALKHIQKKGFAAYRRIDGTAACPELEELVDAGYLTKSYSSFWKPLIRLQRFFIQSPGAD